MIILHNAEGKRGMAMDGEYSVEKLTQILEQAREAGASDIHMAPGIQIMFRIDGALVRMSEERIEPYELERLIEPMLTDTQKKELERAGELDFAYSIAGFNRLRVNVFRQRGTYAMTIRLLSATIPSPESLGIPQSVVELTSKKRGLVIVTGSTGSGKSTTLASLIGVIAQNYSKSIITLEDPIEYLHQHNKSMVIQREIGYDSMSYASALRSALRQDPDVIFIGEMRDTETISMAINAAETGHLVFSTLHTNNVVAAVERMIDVFPPHKQQQIRVQLSGALRGVVAQQLLPKQHASGRVAAFEVMLSNPNVSNLIRENKLHHLQTLLQSSRKEGMQIMDDAIYDLYLKSEISSDTAISYAQDAQGMKQKVQLF